MNKTFLFRVVGLAVFLNFGLPDFSFAQKTQPDSSGGVWHRVEQWPVFSGCAEFEKEPIKRAACSDQKLVEFISEQLVYPPSAIEKGIEGVVVVSFVVEENGSLSQFLVLRELGEGCGEAALNVFRAMPKWEPGRQNGQAVRVKMNLPIRFAFKKNQPDAGQNFTINWGKLKGDRVRKSDLLEVLELPLMVRDGDGNLLKINELSFVFEKGKKTSEAKSDGSATVSKSMKKLASKVSPGGTFTITATIDEGGKFTHAEKTFQVIQ